MSRIIMLVPRRSGLKRLAAEEAERRAVAEGKTVVHVAPTGRQARLNFEFYRRWLERR